MRERSLKTVQTTQSGCLVNSAAKHYFHNLALYASFTNLFSYAPTSHLLKSSLSNILEFLPSATKLRRLCFHTCLSFCTQGVCLSACCDTLPGYTQEPPGPGIPRDQAPPPPAAETDTAADGTHPTGMHSCSNLILSY